MTKKPVTADEAYVFNAKLIGDKQIPDRFMRVTPNFLQKMAQQARDGVSLLIDHPWASGGFLGGSRIAIPYGRTFDAKLQNEPDGELALYADHYIIRDRSFSGINTNDIINAIDDGTMFDTSVGYGTTKNICSIDGLDYFGGVCPHIRGETYDGQACVIDQDDGYLMENSLVFDGAYPTAGVVAASQTGAKVDDKHTLVLTEDEETLKHADRVLFTFSQKHGLQTYAQTSHEGKNLVGLGVVPHDVSEKLAPRDTPWSAPTLSDFTSKAWSDLTDTEKRNIAGHYAWAKEMPPATFGDLKLPHHRPSDGYVVWHGVVNAAERLDQTNIPDADVPKVKTELEHHYHQFGEKAPWEDGGSTESQSKGVKQVEELQKAQEALAKATSDLTASNGILAKVREALGVTEDGAIHATVTALQTKAELGAQYVAKVVEEACGAGVRAMGEAFNVESMKLAFSHLPVVEVEKIRDTYEAQAKSALGGGGQHIVTDPKTLPDNPTANANGNPELTVEQKLAQAKQSARDAMERTGNKNLLKEAN